MTEDRYRICLTNKLLVEQRLSGGQWGFYRICDSPADAKRSLSVLRGDAKEMTEQMDLIEWTEGAE
jgi:hypothetical protein